ncbi:hypothetical protein AX774_g2949, partial [Zancudomyces culisetae]
MSIVGSEQRDSSEGWRNFFVGRLLGGESKRMVTLSVKKRETEAPSLVEL